MSYSSLVTATDGVALSVFGEAIIYTPQAGGAVTVTGIFESQYVIAKGSAAAGVEATGPAAFFRLSDLPTDPEADNPTLTIRGVAYHVIGRSPDDEGGIVLELRRVA